MSQSNGIKGGAADEAFEEQRFLLVGADFLAQSFFFTFKIFYIHKNRQSATH